MWYKSATPSILNLVAWCSSLTWWHLDRFYWQRLSCPPWIVLCSCRTNRLKVHFETESKMVGAHLVSNLNTLIFWKNFSLLDLSIPFFQTFTKNHSTKTNSIGHTKPWNKVLLQSSTTNVSVLSFPSRRIHSSVEKKTMTVFSVKIGLMWKLQNSTSKKINRNTGNLSKLEPL